MKEKKLKHHKKIKAEPVAAVSPVEVGKATKTNDLGECLRIIHDMGADGVKKLKHSYMKLFCLQARNKIEEFPDAEKAVQMDMSFIKLIVELQPSLNEAKGIASAAQIYGHARSLDAALGRINKIEDPGKALEQITAIMKANANLDTQEKKV